MSGSHPRSLRPTYPGRGERLLLRPLAISDADTLLAYRSREDVCRYVPFEPMSRDDIIERIAGQWARTELTDEGQSLTLGAQVGETSELVGGPDASQNGLGDLTPQNSIDRSVICFPLRRVVFRSRA